MASLKLSDSAFGSVGLTITENIDLAALSASLTALLGQTYQIDSLDVSNITQQGLPNFDPQSNTGGLTAVGLGLVGSRLTVGTFDTFFSGTELTDPLSVSGFEILAFTAQTVAPFVESVPEFVIFDGEIFDPSPLEQSLTFDDTLRVFDFSAIGTGPLDVRLGAIALDLDFPGYTLIGNDGDTIFRGNPGFQDVSDYGSNTYLLGEGNNTFFGDFDNAHVTGGSGRDWIFGGFGTDLLLGGAGNDVLFGGESFGPVGSTLDGGEGNDWLYGSRGNHELTGGAGSDRFVFANDYEIVASLPGEGGFVSVNTGFNVSDGETGTNVITDFTAGEDLLLFALDDFMLWSNPDIPLSLEVGQDGDLLNVSIVFDNLDEFFTIEDAGGAMGVGNFIFRVEQSIEPLGSRQFLDQSFFVDQATYDGSFEIVYRSADQSQGADYDRFRGLSLQPDAFDGDGPIGGQDKFDLTALQLMDFDIETGDPLEVSGILFSSVGFLTEPFFGGNFTLFDLLLQVQDEEITLEEAIVADFFLDADFGVSRALHVEYARLGDSDQFDQIMVYIDADGDGDFSLANDMVFALSQLEGRPEGPLTATDLYNPLAEGGGTGIFIFNESQYEFWFNDEVV